MSSSSRQQQAAASQQHAKTTAYVSQNGSLRADPQKSASVPDLLARYFRRRDDAEGPCRKSCSMACILYTPISHSMRYHL
eukprot:COSAG01_NODE_5978_length_3920_cov_210.481026_7_plen_80_part_00